MVSALVVAVGPWTRWQQQPRPAGLHVSTAWVPGNFLAEGTMLVGAALSTLDPVSVHFFERDAVAFQVIDSQDGDSARGAYGGTMPGVIRPLLNWTARFGADAREGAEPVAKEEGA